jgi:hypothetical protein
LARTAWPSLLACKCMGGQVFCFAPFAMTKANMFEVEPLRLCRFCRLS